MALRPILSTLARHRIAAGLIVAEVALSFAFVSNALHMIGTRLERLGHETGVAESELVVLELRGVGPIDNTDALTAEDLRRLRALPGVQGAAVANQVLYAPSTRVSAAGTEPDNRGRRSPAISYGGDEHFLAVHGLRLVAGRNFTPDEVIAESVANRNPDTRVPVVIVNRSLAETLYPGRSALGQPVYVFGNQPSTIVGVVEALPHPSPRSADLPQSLLAPLRPDFRGGSYVLRVEPGRQEAVLKQAAQVVREVDRRRVVGRAQTMSEMRDAYDAEDRAMAWLLGGVSVALLAVTAFGIVGLASFWVAQRTRMIGIRRALGATQAQIRRYFQLENLLLCALGTALGALGALALSQGVLQPQGAPPLPWVTLPVATLLLIALGQLAVLAPARRAAGLPAATAMRA